MSIRILHYVGRMNRGGMETFIMNLYRRIDREKIQFDFAIHGDCVGDFEHEISVLGGIFYHFPQMRKNPLKYRKAWHEFWKENKNRYFAFHMHTNSLANIIALEEATKAGVPVRIVHSHSSMANKGRLQWLNDQLNQFHRKKMPQLATHLFACSDKAAEWLFGGVSIGGLRVLQINNGVDINKFKYDVSKREEIRNELSLNNAKVIGHIGEFIPVKNHRFIVDIVEQAYIRDSSVRCLLIGTGALIDEIKNIVHQRDLDGIISFMGSCENVHQLLSGLDLFLMPSLFEGLPVSLVEAQANGLPSLVSDNITKDVKLRDNLHYMGLSEGAEAWADKLLNIIQNESHDSSVDCIIEQGFDIDSISSMYEKIIIEGKIR